MFDFRYHAVSLVAVFVALILGLLLGVAIGDRGLVSSAENKVRESLRADVRARERVISDLRSQLDRRARFEDEVYPLLVSGQLTGRRIGVVFLGEVNAIADEVKQALQGTGGKRTGVVAIREPLRATDIAERATGTKFAGLDQGPDLYQPLGERVGRALVRGGKFVQRLRRPLFSRFAGQLGPFDGIVVMRNPPEDIPDDQRQAVTDFENGFIRGLTATDVPVVGVADADNGADQLTWYHDQDLSTVDDLDDIAGRAALVFVLTGSNEGSFGFDAPRLLPDIAGGVGG